MKTLQPASTGPPGRALRRSVVVVGLVVGLVLLTAAVAAAQGEEVFNHCANRSPGVTGCDWTTGNLGGNNSLYAECTSVPHRMWLVGETTGSTVTCGNAYTFRLTIDSLKGGVHRFDYLTTYNIKTELCKDITGCPASTTPTEIAIPYDASMPSGVQAKAAGQFFTVWSDATLGDTGATLISTSGGNLVIDVTFKPTCTTGTTKVLLAFGAHLASSATDQWGAQQGAAWGDGAWGIHSNNDGTLTVKAGTVVQPPAIQIVKVPDPLSTTRFYFDTQNLGPQFFLYDNGGINDPNAKSFSALGMGTDYSVTEVEPTPPWAFERLECTLDGAAYTSGVSQRTVSIKFDSTQAGSILSCTYYNKRSSTAVKLASFAGKAAGSQVQLEWQTGTETDNAGFNVLRSRLPTGPYVKVNAQLIGATGDAVAGTSYSFTDRPGFGLFFYKLEDVDLSGNVTAHGPVQVKIVWPFLRLPFQPALPAQ